MGHFNAPSASPVKIRSYIFVLSLAWTAIVAAFLVWNIAQIKKANLDMVRIQARASFNKDVLYRKWNAGHGGVYVPVTRATRPNPSLTAPHRDVICDSGIMLTLINPAFMTRQVHEIALKGTGVKGHITSLNPIRPDNAPDPWEEAALKAFAQGAKEVSSVVNMDGSDHLRLMRPLMTTEGCLKCHGVQGYKLGQVRGGISATVPISEVLDIERSQILSMSLGHGLLWFFGLAGLFFAMGRLDRQIRSEHEMSQNALVESEIKYRGIFENAVEGMYTADVSGRYMDVNPAMAAILGYDSPRELLEMITDIGAQLYVKPGNRNNFLEQLRENGRIKGLETEIYRRDQSRIWVEINARAVRDDKGDLSLVEGFIVDITARKQMETALRKGRDELEIRVKERTADLKEKSAKLERMNKLFIDREMKIKELKARIEQLEG